MVGHCLGKAEVAGSNPARGSTEPSLPKEASPRNFVFDPVSGFDCSKAFIARFKAFSLTFERFNPKSLALTFRHIIDVIWLSWGEVKK